MTIVQVRMIGVATATACAVPFAGMAFVTGPDPGKTGGFGEMTCHECHWDNPLNEPGGRLALLGIPTTYTPGERYLITVDLAHPELVLGGFQLTARFDGESSAGVNAGVLHTLSELTARAFDESGRITYVQHTKAGATAASSGAARWTVEWTAPTAGGAIIFHAAGNASNGDASALGDFIYTATASTDATR